MPGLGEHLAGDVVVLHGLFGLPGEEIRAFEARGGLNKAMMGELPIREMAEVSRG